MQPAVPVRRPRRLVRGDRVAVVTPAAAVDTDRLDIGLAVLRDWGLVPELLPSALLRHDRLSYLAGADEARAKDLRAAWLDSSYAAVLCARGGYGVQRLLPHLDLPELLAAPEKVLLGFSDVTALHEPLNAAGLVTVHGPMVAAVAQITEPVGAERLRRLLFEPESVTDLLAPVGARTVVGGRAEGVLRGGNAALLSASVGTPTYAPPGGAVVVLEDIDEDAFQLDRLVTHLLRAGWFDGVAGIVVGDLCDTDDAELAADVLRERLAPLGVPMVEGAAIGHDDLNLAIPLGVPVVLDADTATLVPAVVPLV